MSEILLSSRIDTVTVYRSGALVRRVATLPSNARAESTFRVVGLPLALEDASCRVSVEGDSAMRAVDLRIGLDVVAGAVGSEPPTEEELRIARTNEAVVRTRHALARDFREKIASITIEARNRVEQHPPGASPTSARLELVAMRRDEIASLDRDIAQLAADLREAERVRADVEQRHSLATSEREARPNELRKSAIVGLVGLVGLVGRVGEASSDARIVLEYQVPGARWVPAYTLRLDRAMKNAELAMRALIAQNTGEDWGSVRLTLSTALPSAWTELPKLPSLRIGRRQPAPEKRGWRDPPAGAAALFADFDRVFGAPASPPVPRGAPAPFGPPVALGDAAAQPISGAVPPTTLMQTFAAPAPAAMPAPSAMPAPTAAPGMAPLATRAAYSLGALLSPAPMPQSAAPAAHGGAPPMAQQARLRGGPPYQGANAEPVPEEPSHIEAPEAMLDFDGLTMPGPRDLRRGQPTPTQRLDRYLALLHSTRDSFELDVRSLLFESIERARRIDGLVLPTGHCAPTTTGGFDYAYVAEQTVDVASDGAFHSTPVALRSAASTPRYVVVPRMQTDAFRTVAFEAPLAGPVLEGPVDVYADGEFLVTSRFQFAPPKGRIELGLGVEEAIKVARNTTYREETQGLLRGTIALAHSIRIEISNGLPDRAPIEIRERVPVPDSSENELEVELVKLDPPSTPYRETATPLLGGHAFQLDVPARGKATVAIDYAIKVPSKRELVGGNRREGV